MPLTATSCTAADQQAEARSTSTGGSCSYVTGRRSLPGHPPGRHVLVHRRHSADHRPLLHHLRRSRSAPTTVVYGVPDSPDGGRPWRFAQRLASTSPQLRQRESSCCESVQERRGVDYHRLELTTTASRSSLMARWSPAVGEGEAQAISIPGRARPAASSEHPACPAAMKPGSCGPAYSASTRSCSTRMRRRFRPDRAGRATSASGTRGRASCRPSGASPSGSSRSTTQVQQGPGEQRLARLAVLRRRRSARGRWLLQDPRPGRRRDQRGGRPARHQGARICRAHRARGRRGTPPCP